MGTPPTPGRRWSGPRNGCRGAAPRCPPRGTPVHTVLSSATKQAVIGPDQPFCIIGERINPTGRKAFQEELRRGDLSRVETDVPDQVACGPILLHVTMGPPLAHQPQ